jgi:cellulose synthase/poly-beta-1,6-N-acetylglucosamine synthase-like glycosyltransferase
VETSTTTTNAAAWTPVLMMLGVCVIGLAASTILLFLGRRFRVPLLGVASDRVRRLATQGVSVLLGIGLGVAAALVAVRLWNVSTAQATYAVLVIAAATGVVVLAKPRWEPPAHLFGGAFVAASVVYLTFGAAVTFGGYFGPVGSVGAGLLVLLQIVALAIAGSFVFESLDAVFTVGPSSREVAADPTYRPMVSLHIAAYNEPPDILIEAIRAAEAIDYPRFEVVVVDNGTEDAALWMPVREYCEGRPNLKFVHVDAGPGPRSGALNLALSRSTHPDAALIGVIDADHLVRADYLSDLVALFADPSVAFVQTPQGHRDVGDDPYLTATHDAYRFFLSSMPVRAGWSSMVSPGTMGLFRRDVLEDIGGWNEWCVTENAEASLRMLRDGHQGVFVDEAYGRGIVPLSFATLKEQRFRWSFGGMQILRRRWRDLMPWSRDPLNQLTQSQRFDYLLRSLRWLGDLLLLGFAAVLLAVAVALAVQGSFAVGPLLVIAAVGPIALIASNLLRGFWALEARARVGARRAWLALANSLALSWTVAIACVNGLIRAKRVYLRAPDRDGRPGVLPAVATTKEESVLAALLWGGGAALAVAGLAGPLLVALFAGLGAVYASAPLMAWMNQRTRLTPQLERRAATEQGRGRVARAAPLAFGVGVPGAIAVLAVAVSVFGVARSTPPTAGAFFGTHDERAAAVPTAAAQAPELGGAPDVPSVSPAPRFSPTPTVGGAPFLAGGTSSTSVRDPAAPRPSDSGPAPSPSSPAPSTSSPSPTDSPSPSPTDTSPPPSPTDSPTPSDSPDPHCKPRPAC